MYIYCHGPYSIVMHKLREIGPKACALFRTLQVLPLTYFDKGS